ncbi:MAG TPA: hypothetical protein VG963_09815 [Polyangiaceae bacterium]|nr:hypothetical protein [Polyangiaceae bacterium]
MQLRVREFVDETAPPLTPNDAPSRLRAAYAAGKIAWPSVALSREEYAQHLDALGWGEELPAHPADLYLCAACGLGQRQACEALESTHFPALRVRLQRMLKRGDAVEEVLQIIRTRLFLGCAPEPPKIAKYRGDGTLRGWLQTVALRAAQDCLRAAKLEAERAQRLSRAVHTSKPTDAWLLTPSMEERAFENDRTRIIERAWCAAIRSLDASQRQLLHHHFVSGLSIDVIAALYAGTGPNASKRHRSTIARRIQRAAHQVGKHVRTILSARYRELSFRELDLLALDACSRLDIAGTLVLE